ncbi:ATP-binding protein [Stenotrophomonas sp.]|uniref:ATP-binding protein n=1 Tax=Stenotrophomonas sp. TaxID=69392 RepID=UPI0028AAC062|nr:ATP-binding protein [Stenotrophomonas sp.]
MTRPRVAPRGQLATLLLVAGLAWPGLVSALVVQVPWPRQLGAADGLPDPHVREIAEDATGYLWLAGSDGLMRFDGQRYRLWRHDEGLPDADVRTLHVDAQDRLWLGTATRGLVMMGPSRNGFQRVDASAPAAIRTGHVRQVTGTRDGWVWVIGDDRRLYGLPPRQARWQHHPLKDDAVGMLARDAAGALWAGAGTTLWRWDGNAFVTVPLPVVAPVQSLWPDPQGGIEVGTARGTWALDAGQRVRAGPLRTRSVLRSADAVLWQQRDGVLQWRDGDQARPVALHPAPGPVVVRQALQDRHGDLWWVTERHGVWWLSARWRQFSALPGVQAGGPGLRSPPAVALAASGEHHAWVMGRGGRLQRLDLRDGRSSEHIGYAHAGDGALAIGLTEDAAGRVWTASADRLARYDPARRQWQEWRTGLGTRHAAITLHRCADTQLWLSHPQAIQQWSTAGTLLRSTVPAALGLTADVPARQLLCTRDGNVFATDPEGMMRWSSGRERFEPLDGDSGGMAAAVAEADDGTLWVSRHGALEHYRLDRGRLQRLRRVAAAEGYPQLRADALAVGTDGAAWAGTARGLVRVGPRRGDVRLLGHAQGLPVQEVLGQALLRLGSGALLARMGEGGLLAFDPRALREPDHVPVLVMEAISRRRQGRLLPVPLDAAPVLLSTADRTVRVAVSLLGRGDPDRIQYRFRLLGQDPGWIDTGPVAQRLFARLPPGEHVLLMQARHAEGPWSAVRQVSLRVVPLWWETGAGRATIVGALCTVAILLARLHQRQRRWRDRRRQARAGRIRAEQDSAQRSRFLAELGRQVRSPLTPVLGWSELLLHSPLSPIQRQQIGSLQQAGHHLLHLMDDALDLASIESGRLQLQGAPFALEPLLRELHALQLPVAHGKGLSLHWSSTFDGDACFHGDVQRLRQILLNLLGNAVKFTARGQVCLSARAGRDGQGVVLGVDDTGPGMNADQVHGLFQRFRQAEGAQTAARHGGSGLGLAISRDLARAMGGDIEVESHPGRGTRFQLVLPWSPAPSLVASSAATGTACGGDAEARSLRVMVLLPSADAADVVCALLRAQGHRVTGVDDLDGWMRDVDPGPWDLIAADPDMLAGGARLNARLPWLWPGVPRLALTPRADACAERDARAGGFDLFLRLPLTSARLAAGIARCRAPA